MLGAWRAVALLLLGLVACAPAPGPIPARAVPGDARVEPAAAAWPDGEVLFRRDPRWLGGDAAVTVDLGDGRVLWLFGDSFVAPATAPTPATDRAGAAMVRNSIAIQRGDDPRSASMRFLVGPGPSAFFSGPEDRWYWPQHGIVLDGALTLFVYELAHDSSHALGFRYVGWGALRIDEPGLPPERWQPRALPVPQTAPIEMVGVSVLEVGPHVVAYGVREPGDHAVFVLRWERAAFARGDLSDPRVWAGPSRGWTRGPPEPLLSPGQTEFSVVPRRGGFAMLHTVGFGSSTLAVRFAPAVNGPFGPPRPLHRPAEHGREGILIYGARAHPQLRAPAGSERELLVTYNVNSLDAGALMGGLSLYFPRFVRVSW